MKHAILTTLFIGLCIFNVQAQENARKNKGKVTAIGNNGMRTNRDIHYVKAVTVSLGGGYVTPGSAAKSNAYMVNTPSINADVFFPLFGAKTNRVAGGPQKGWDGHLKSFGLNISGTYFTGGNGNPTTPLPTGYAVTGATASNMAYRGVDPKSPGFIVAAGPQLNIGLGNHFMVSPVLPVGYMSITQKALSAVQTTSYNGKDYEFNITSVPQSKISGFSFNPAIRLQYMFTSAIGLWLQGSYLMGPTAKTTTTSLIPNGPAQTPGNTYNLQQLQTATYKQNATVNTKYNAVGFGGGVVISFGRIKPHGRYNPLPPDGTKLKPPYSPTNPNDPKTGEITAVKKGWDGTVKGLFNVKNPDIIVPKNGGVEKLIAQINKQGKSTATKETYDKKQYIKVVTAKNENYVTDFYPIDNSGNFTVIGAGGSSACFGSCKSGCSLFSGGCICNGTGDGVHPYDPALCSGYIVGPVLSHLGSILVADLEINFESGTTLSSATVKNIKDLVIAKMPKATIDKVEVVKNDKEKYLKIDVKNEGAAFVLLSQVNTKNNSRTVSNGIWSIMMYCGGICATKANCLSKTPVWGSTIYCPCTGGGVRDCNPQFGRLVGWQED